ncbi:MAG TPA: 23S rRNA (adenine(2030)-N(6))-methyltransferase RlmJ [Rhodocyclaceae bacterium]|nr:23S rRNA (adenine(2030)-N(6))-methyltransferase RlmJ [Rhodocyclaceae bacterium]
MFSYRHAFHAGNHADVLKHIVLLQLIKQLQGKDKPFWAIDTHAGAGLYALDEGHAKQLAEYREGIAKFWGRTDLPPVVADYLAAVQEVNPDGKLTRYPGSPWLAYRHLREQDKLRLFELHTTDARLLDQNFSGAGKQVLIQQEDGLAGLKSLLPPPPRRGLVLIDPSYEDKRDYLVVYQTLRDALERFSTGVYALWYPCLARSETRDLPEKLKRLKNANGAKGWLHVELRVRDRVADESGRIGMYGSGLVVLNPPWKLFEILQEVMPFLTETLAQGEGAGFTLEQESE